MLKWLTTLRDLIYAILKITKKIEREKHKRDLGKALDKTIEERDQRHVEESLSDDAGQPTRYEYGGLRTQEESESSDRDLAD